MARASEYTFKVLLPHLRGGDHRQMSQMRCGRKPGPNSRSWSEMDRQAGAFHRAPMGDLGGTREGDTWGRWSGGIPAAGNCEVPDQPAPPADETSHAHQTRECS